jgi:hypothetical protein
MDMTKVEVEALENAVAQHDLLVMEQITQLQGVMLGGGMGDVTLG